MVPEWILITVLVLLILCLAGTGFNLLTGRWSIPRDTRGRVSWIGLVTLLVFGILSILFMLNPKWSDAFSKALRRKR